MIGVTNDPQRRGAVDLGKLTVTPVAEPETRRRDGGIRHAVHPIIRCRQAFSHLDIQTHTQNPGYSWAPGRRPEGTDFLRRQVNEDRCRRGLRLG